MTALHVSTRSFALVVAAMFTAAVVALGIGGCASTAPPVPTNPPPQQVEPEPWQLQAAARTALTTMEENGIDLHGSRVLHGDDWQHYVDGCKTARSLLNEAGAAAIDPETIAKAVAIAKAAVRTGQAAWLMANAASIGEADAAKYEAAGVKADELFDAYARDHPD